MIYEFSKELIVLTYPSKLKVIKTSNATSNQAEGAANDNKGGSHLPWHPGKNKEEVKRGLKWKGISIRLINV
jgi:hypothetical protein